MEYDFHGKAFRVLVNEGPGADVTTETVFYFKQDGDIISADYSGGLVQVGKLLGKIEGNQARHSYMQYNTAGQFRAGQGVDEIRLSADGKLQLIDSWKWEDGSGTGYCIMEEM